MGRCYFFEIFRGRHLAYNMHGFGEEDILPPSPEPEEENERESAMPPMVMFLSDWIVRLFVCYVCVCVCIHLYDSVIFVCSFVDCPGAPPV